MGHRTLCNCNLEKKSEDEENFIRVALWCVPEVIQRRTRTHVGGHEAQGQVTLLSYHRKDRIFLWMSCADFNACIFIFGCCGCLDKYPTLISI